MEARRQYYEPDHTLLAGHQYFLSDAEFLPTNVLSYQSEDVRMEFLPVDQDAQQLPLLYPFDSVPIDSSQLYVGENDDTTPKIEFSTQWNNRKEAVWDIVGPKRGMQAFITAPVSEARAAPEIWAENIYDAQDVLPYFTIGQTILASKIPRAVSRSVLLTSSLHDVRADWRAGKIGFTVQVRYKLQLNRPKRWKAPSSNKMVNVDCKPMDPIQFRKLRACYEGGIPVRVLATGDFPSLPTFQSKPQEEGGPIYPIGSGNWQNGVVMLGFFWVNKVREIEHSFDSEDIETGKCSGRSKWVFEFLSCDINNCPPWWCPLGDDSEEDSTQSDYSIPDDDEWEPSNASKRRRVEEYIDPQLCVDASMFEVIGQNEERGWSKVKPVPSYPHVDWSGNNWALHHTDPVPDGIHTHTEINAPPGCLPNIPKLSVSTMINANSRTSVKPPAIAPKALGLSLEPIVGNNQCLSRAPKLRASLLLGWHCLTCGRLNPRKKWLNQLCPLCKTISTALILPEWHRRAHTEAVGPIGTLFRLDDGGHQLKTGLHQMAARDEETGLTFVEYWLADAPMPIVAELNRAHLADRRKTRRKVELPKTLKAPQPDMIPSTDASTLGPNTAAPASISSTSVSTVNPQTTAPSIQGRTHPDGGKLIRQRDPGGSRAVFSENTRMLFMHITRPQHPTGLALVDRIFSGFATEVQMERQENNASYRTGASALSCHYTYLAGCGTHVMHTSSPAVDWEEVPGCVYDAHALLVDYQTHTVFNNNKTVREFNQSIYIVGNGDTGTSTFRITHRAEDGPIGYMVFGASCSIEILVGNGENAKKTTKGGATRRAEVLLAHGDALMTMPVEGDAPLQVRVKRTGLAVVSIARHVVPVSAQVETPQGVPRKERLPVLKKLPTPVNRDVTPAKRKARTPSVKHPKT
ncbi:unnamed protein product [Rhizoctonia solani]|nr:hypothetical protein RSOL_428380 [Rhizoctonia solani AG-3 Rhs1AP]KEP50731.1 hypothetical protein V565_074460 [Rhizoctonia solani 123E]CAE6348537.1 unnamed protein product [Rhizoctonia solani]